MDLVATHLHAFYQILDFAVDPDFGIALLTNLLEQLAVVALAAPDEGSEDDDLLAGVALGNLLLHLLFGEAEHGFATEVTVGGTGPGVEQAEEVIDFGDRADRGARAAVGRLLLDGDNGTQTGDLFHLGPLHRAHKLAGIAAKGFHVAPLAFSVDGVESKARFAAAAKAGDHDEFVARQLHTDVLQVILPCTNYAQEALGVWEFVLFGLALFGRGRRCRGS